MAVAFDAKPTGSGNKFDVAFAGATSFDLTTMTVGSGANRALIVGIIFTDQSSISSLAAHWDSAGTNQAMTIIGTVTSTSGIESELVLLGLLAPTSGNLNLHVSWTNTANGYASAISWTGVDQAAAATSFINFNSNNNAAPSNVSSITVTTTSGNATVEWGGNRGSLIFSSTNQTLWSADNAANPNQWSSYALSAGSSTVYNTTLNGTGGDNLEVGCDIVAVQAVAGAMVGILVAHG